MTEKVKYYVGLLGKFLIKRENTNYQKKSQALLKHSSHFFLGKQVRNFIFG